MSDAEDNDYGGGDDDYQEPVDEPELDGDQQMEDVRFIFFVKIQV